MALALGRLGFDVTTVRDADRVEMTTALRVFTRASAGAAGADVSLVFYAGHGLEMDGVNYLVPVDAQLERDTDVRFEAIELDDVLASTVGAGLRVVILDACRNNPLARSMQRTGASRSVSRGSFGDPHGAPAARRRRHDGRNRARRAGAPGRWHQGEGAGRAPLRAGAVILPRGTTTKWTRCSATTSGVPSPATM